MFWSKSKSKPEQSTSTAVVRQDARTTVKTVTAQSATTNTSVKNATTFNKNTNTIKYQTTTQTVTHEEHVGITEKWTRRTPSPEELEEMLRTLKMNKSEASTSNARRRPDNLPAITYKTNGILPKSTTKFKSTTTSPATRFFSADSPNSSASGGASFGSFADKRYSGNSTTPTLVKTQQSTVTQKNGRTVTSHVEQQRIKLDAMPAFKLSTPNSPLTHSYSAGKLFRSIDAKPYELAKTTTATKTYVPTIPTASSAAYTSPYLKSGSLYGAAATAPTPQPTANSNNANSKSSSAKSNYISGKPNAAGATTSAASPFAREFNATVVYPNPPSPLTHSSSGATTTATTTTTKKKPKLKPGYAYIFNNELFDDPKNEYRTGSSEDVKLLRKTFEFFKLKVSVIENATLERIAATVHKIETKDYSSNSCLIIVILSHGSRYEEVAAKDGSYSIDDKILFPILRNRTLMEKPKMLFIQACKGAMEIGGFHKDSVQPHGSANEVLKCCSTFEGYVSYRSKEGSIFIKALCENLRLFGGIKSIKDIMETVTLLVKQQSQNKQIPAFTSTLTVPYIFGDYV